MFSSARVVGDVVPKTMRVIKCSLERQAPCGRLENILLSHFIVFSNVLGIISNLFLAYRTKSDFKTIRSYTITCNVFGNSKPMSSIVCSERIWGTMFVALSFICPLAAMLLCPFCKNTVLVCSCP